jgi:hypothetical protein
MQSGLFNFDGRIEEHIHCILRSGCGGSCLQITSRLVLRAFASPDARSNAWIQLPSEA